MVEILVGWLWIGVVGYVTLGVIFAVTFITRGVNHLDRSAKNGSWGFRVAIFPAAAILWPFLAIKLRHRANPDDPANPEAPLSPLCQRLLHGVLIMVLALLTIVIGSSALSSREVLSSTTVKIP